MIVVGISYFLIWRSYMSGTDYSSSVPRDSQNKVSTDVPLTPTKPMKPQRKVGKTSIGTLGGVSDRDPQPSLLGKFRSLWNKSSSDSTSARDSVSTQSSHSITSSKRGSESARGSESVGESPPTTPVPSKTGVMQKMSQLFRRSSLPKSELEKEFERIDNATKEVIEGSSKELKEETEKLKATHKKLEQAAEELKKAADELQKATVDRELYPKTTTRPYIEYYNDKVSQAQIKHNKAMDVWGGIKKSEEVIQGKIKDLEEAPLKMKKAEGDLLAFKIDIKKSRDVSVLIKTSIGYEEMLELAKQTHCGENVEFLKEVDEYKALVKKFKTASSREQKEEQWKLIQEKHSNIIQKFIIDDAPSYVNLASENRRTTFDELTPANMENIFDKAAKEIRGLTNPNLFNPAGAGGKAALKRLEEKYSTQSGP